MPNILLLDNNDRNARVVESVLGVLGYEILRLADAERLKLEIRARKPQLVMVSADLQSGSGLDLLRDEYKQFEEPVPVIAWSNYHKPDALKELAPVELNLCAVMSAPLDPGELVRLAALLAPPDDKGAAVQVVADLAAEAGSDLRLDPPSGTKPLAKVELAQSLCGIDRHDWTGCLRIHQDRHPDLSLFFEMGQLVFAGSEDGKDLTETARQLGRLEGSRVPNVPLRNLEEEMQLLMAVRGIGLHETAWLAEETAVRLLSLAFDAWDGELAAIPGLAPEDSFPEPLALMPVLIRAVVGRAAASEQDVLDVDPDAVVVVRLPDGQTVRSWALSGVEREVLDQLASARGREITLAQVLRIVAADDPARIGRVKALVELLRRIGFLHFSGRPWGAETGAKLLEMVRELHRMRRSDHFQVLGLKPDAGEREIREALRSRSRKYHPDTLFGQHPRVQETANALYSRIQDSYEVLKDEQKRLAYKGELAGDADSTDNSLGKVALARGKIRMRHKRYQDAVGDFEDATLHDPKNQDAQVLLAWARFRLEPDNPRKAMGEMSKVVRKDESCADAWYYLGRLAFLQGEHDNARKYFRRTLKADAAHVEATRELRLMDRRGQGQPDAVPPLEGDEPPSDDDKPKKGGLFARLRGRK